MPSRESIRQTLLELLEKETGEKPQGLSDSSKFREELGLDSVDVVSVVMQIEAHFRIRLAHQELEHLANVGEFIDLIQSKLAAGGPEATVA